MTWALLHIVEENAFLLFLSLFALQLCVNHKQNTTDGSLNWLNEKCLLFHKNGVYFAHA